MTLQNSQHSSDITKGEDTIRRGLLPLLKQSLEWRRQAYDGVTRQLQTWSDFKEAQYAITNKLQP